MQPEYIYRVGPVRRALPWAIWAVLVLPLLAGGALSGESALLFTGVVGSAILLPVFYFTVWTSRLTLRASGVELRHVGVNVSTDWSNIRGFIQRPGAEGFVLSRPLSGGGAERMASSAGIRIGSAAMYDSERQQLLAARRFVPIEGFAHALRHGDLRAAIEQWAPALLQASPLPEADGEIASG